MCNLQVVNVGDPQSAQPISESYLVEISLMTTVQKVIVCIIQTGVTRNMIFSWHLQQGTLLSK